MGLVLLSEHNSKKYQAALRLKRQIAETPDKFSLAEGDTGINREIDEFGEVATKRVQRVQRRLTPEEVRMLIIEYQSGKTPIELSEKYGCHRITIGRILRRNGVDIRPNTIKRDDAAIVSGYQSGKSTYKLALEFGCDPSTISRTLKEYGVTVSNCKAQQKLDVKNIITMYAEMHTAEEIAKRFKVSSKSIIKCLRENGVKIRTRWDYGAK